VNKGTVGRWISPAVIIMAVETATLPVLSS
jgi:hypothetical protein